MTRVRWGACLAVIATLATVTACSTPEPPMLHPAGTGTARYVALGDSWVSGPLIGEPVGNPVGCGRSANNYPHRIAHLLDVQQFVDASCGSASTKHLTERQKDNLGTFAPPQFDALTEDTTLVTIGMGGNDIKFDSLALSCVNLLPFPLGRAPFGQPCVDRYVRNGVDEVSQRVAATRKKIDAALAGIHERAPRAKVVVTGYMAPLPDQGEGCWPQVPLLPRDVAYLRAKFREMNQMLVEAAAAAGDTFVDLYTPSLGHDLCTPYQVAWVNGLAIDPAGIPLHPNEYGHANVAPLVAAAAGRALAAG
jgi:lysophospholipase L1-like esterase